MVQLPGTSRGPKLSWEGGVASHWARGKHPREGAPGRTIVKEARGVGGEAADKAEAVARPASRMPFLGTLPGPWTCHFLSLYDLAAFPAFHRRAHRGAASARPDLVQRKAWAPGLSHPPVPGPRAWVSGAGWPLCSPSPPDILTRAAASGLAPSASSLRSPVRNFQICLLHSAVSNQAPSLSPFSHFFFPLLEFDSSSPQNGICTKAATPNLDLHTPLRFVFNCIN